MLQLPEKIQIPDDAITQIPELFKIFKKDFIDNKTYFMAYPVIVAPPKNGETYPEVFWHIISQQTQKGSKSNNTRLIDYKRAKRLCWIKPIIQQYKDEQLTSWRSKEFDKNTGKEIYKYYFWYKEGKFMVILNCIETKTKKFFIATSFYVFDSNVAYYEELSSKGEKIN